MKTEIELANALLAEVNAHLDGNDDDEMGDAAEALQDSIHDTKAVDPDLARALIRQVDALLDYEEDADMQKAVEAFREAFPAIPAPPVG